VSIAKLARLMLPDPLVVQETGEGKDWKRRHFRILHNAELAWLNSDLGLACACVRVVSPRAARALLESVLQPKAPENSQDGTPGSMTENVLYQS